MDLAENAVGLGLSQRDAQLLVARLGLDALRQRLIQPSLAQRDLGQPDDAIQRAGAIL